MLHNLYSTKYYHIDQIKKDEIDRECNIGIREINTKFSLEIPKGRDHSIDQDIDGRTWTGLIWLRIDTNGRLL
jgi:hypothetical protein